MFDKCIDKILFLLSMKASYRVLSEGQKKVISSIKNYEKFAAGPISRMTLSNITVTRTNSRIFTNF